MCIRRSSCDETRCSLSLWMVGCLASSMFLCIRKHGAHGSCLFGVAAGTSTAMEISKTAQKRFRRLRQSQPWPAMSLPQRMSYVTERLPVWWIAVSNFISDRAGKLNPAVDSSEDRRKAKTATVSQHATEPEPPITVLTLVSGKRSQGSERAHCSLR